MRGCKFFSFQLARARKQPFKVAGQVRSSLQPVSRCLGQSHVHQTAMLALPWLALPWLLAEFQLADAQTLILGVRVMNEGSASPCGPDIRLSPSSRCGTFPGFSLATFGPDKTQNAAPSVSGSRDQRRHTNWLRACSQTSWTLLPSPLERRRPSRTSSSS